MGGYERETRDNIGPDVSLLTESAVFGGERVIKKPLGDWQHTIGVRYRLDRLTQKGNVDISELPDALKLPLQSKKRYCLVMKHLKLQVIHV